MLLRDSPHKGAADWALAAALAEGAAGADGSGRRAEFLHLIETAHDLSR